jgi:chromosomal replication initiation ATPase DnaA
MKPIIRRLAYVAAEESGLQRDEIFATMPLVARPTSRRIAWPRFAVMKVAHEQGKSYRQIADHLGFRDHTSIIYGCRRASELVATNPVIAALIDRLREEAGR